MGGERTKRRIDDGRKGVSVIRSKEAACFRRMTGDRQAEKSSGCTNTV